MGYIYDVLDPWDNASITYTGISLNVTKTAEAGNSLLMNLLINNTGLFKIDQSGCVLLTDGTALRPALGFNSDADGTGTGFYKSATNTIGVSINGNTRMTFADAGFTANYLWSNGYVVSSSDYYARSNTASYKFGTADDVVMTRLSAGNLRLHDGTNNANVILNNLSGNNLSGNHIIVAPNINNHSSGCIRGSDNSTYGIGLSAGNISLGAWLYLVGSQNKARLKSTMNFGWSSDIFNEDADTTMSRFTSGGFIFNGPANTHIINITGYSLTGGGTAPIINLSGTWNTSGTPTLIKSNIIDTSSNASSYFIEFQRNNSNVFSLDKFGSINISKITANNADFYTNFIRFNFETYVGSDTANTLAIRNGTNTNSLRVYKTYTSSSDFARLAINANQIRSEASGASNFAITSNTPILDLNQIWNSGSVAFTGINLNITDSGSTSTSTLLNLSVSDSSVCRVTKGGLVQSGPVAEGVFFGRTAAYYATMQSNGNYVQVTSAGYIELSANGGTAFGTPGTGPRVYVRDEANDILAMRNGTSAQAFRIYNTWTNANNNEYLQLSYTGNTARIETLAGATGGTVRNLALGTSGLSRWIINATGGDLIPFINNTYNIGNTGQKVLSIYAAIGQFNQLRIPQTGVAASNLELYLSGDINNPSVEAAYLIPHSTSTRLFFGRSGRAFYSLNLSNVSNIESAPPFSTSDGVQWGGTNSFAAYRAGDRFLFNAGSPTAGGYQWYASNTGYMNIGAGSTLKMELIPDASTTGGGLIVYGNITSTNNITPSGHIRLISGGVIPSLGNPETIFEIVAGLQGIITNIPLNGQLGSTLTTGGGSATKHNDNRVSLSSSATPSGAAAYQWNNSTVNNSAHQCHRQWNQDQRQLPWDQPMAVKIAFLGSNISPNGGIRLFYGKPLSISTTGVPPNGKGIGVRFASGSLPILMAHNGTNLTQASGFSALSPTLSTTRMHEVMLFSNTGVMRCYINGSFIGSCTGAPTTLGTQNECAICVETNNGGDAVAVTAEIGYISFLKS